MRWRRRRPPERLLWRRRSGASRNRRGLENEEATCRGSDRKFDPTGRFRRAPKSSDIPRVRAPLVPRDRHLDCGTLQDMERAAIQVRRQKLKPFGNGRDIEFQTGAQPGASGRRLGCGLALPERVGIEGAMLHGPCGPIADRHASPPPDPRARPDTGCSPSAAGKNWFPHVSVNGRWVVRA